MVPQPDHAGTPGKHLGFPAEIGAAVVFNVDFRTALVEKHVEAVRAP